MSKAYKALDVARYIIKRCNSRNQAISNLKLQKILYFVQAEFLVTKGIPCFDEAIEAWDFGPVVPEVYREYKIFGSTNIPVIGKSSPSNKIKPEDQSLINGIVDECAQYSASTLVEITHHQSPWLDAYVPGLNQCISKKSIQKYFS